MEFDGLELSGRHVVLRPTVAADLDALWAASIGADPWRFAPRRPQTPAELSAVVEQMVREREQGKACAFTIRRRTGEVIGSTAYLARELAHRRVEIGATWLAVDARRSAVNTECKLLLLAHAFEVLGCVRVEFKTDARNTASRAALLRIGAREEGILRSHMVMPDGHLRDSVCFSILAPEWPPLRQRLRSRLGSGPGC